MGHATRSTICLVAMLCIGLAVPLVEAFDGFLGDFRKRLSYDRVRLLR